MATIPTKKRKKQDPKKPRNGGKPIVEVDLADISDDLTPLMKRFVQEYLKDFNGTRAYKDAGYAAKDDNVAASGAWILLRKEKIRAALQKTHKKAESKTPLTPSLVLQRLQEEGDLYDETASHGARVRAWELLGKHLGTIPTSTALIKHNETTNNNTLIVNGVPTNPDGTPMTVLHLTDLPPSLVMQIVRIMREKGATAIDFSGPLQLGLPALTHSPAPVIDSFAPLPTEVTVEATTTRPPAP
jgi:hypothetical protein